MPPYCQPIDDSSLLMMRRALLAECTRRNIGTDGNRGNRLALTMMRAFRSGMTDEKELGVLISNLTD